MTYSPTPQTTTIPIEAGLIRPKIAVDGLSSEPISTPATKLSVANFATYGASKAALQHLSRIWGEELRDQGVKVIAVDPGGLAPFGPLPTMTKSTVT